MLWYYYEAFDVSSKTEIQITKFNILRVCCVSVSDQSERIDQKCMHDHMMFLCLQLKGWSAKPQRVNDMWVCTGKQKEAQYTWDPNINNNKQFGSNRKPCYRFDRLYIRHANEVKVEPVHFELVGKQKIASCQRFPSYHWGILAYLDMKK